MNRSTCSLAPEPSPDVVCRNRADYERSIGQPEWTARWNLEQSLLPARMPVWPWSRIRIRGHCPLCDRPATFITKARHLRSGSRFASSGFRDGMICSRCRLLGRHRKLLQLLDADPASRTTGIYLCEQRSRFHAVTSDRYPAVTGSEFLGPDIAPGSVVGGIRHEDLQRLSFAAAQFGFVICSDVLEHVPDHRHALAEIHRVLRPRGTALLTVPFSTDADACTQRAVLEDGRIRHLLPPQMHHNPISRQGSLVYGDFGWELLDHCRAIGFTDVALVLYWSLTEGHLGIPLHYLRLGKSG
ncbi:MAG: class I SAM-dependent methyltransferase [Planctomycetes bacterium]|nr:class I SAM-dependent methyltransferase [Planctomycetota bacterium]